MAVNSTSGIVGMGPSSDAATGSSKLGKDEFLKLLMAQLAHQDPTSPADSNAFVAQLAQFSSMEQLQQVNSQLEALLVAQTANNSTSATNLVGRDVLYRTDTLHLDDAHKVNIRGNLASAAGSVTAVITDSNGKEVRRLDLGAHEAGTFDATWDGRDGSGNTLPVGDYKVKLTATDTAGKSVDIDTRGSAHVTAVSFEKGYPELMVAGVKVKLADVLEIQEQTASNP